DDFNDDDFTEERLQELLIECPWEIREVLRMATDQTGQYENNTLTFSEGGVVLYQNVMGSMLTGEWSTRVTDDGIALNLVFDGLMDFTLEWIVYDIGDHKIKLYSDEGNRIVLRQHCPDDDDNGDDSTSVDGLRQVLKQCEWIIKKVENQGEELERLLGFEFNFLPGEAVTLSDGISTIQGTWEVGMNNDQVLSLLITMGDEPGVSFDWPLRELDDRRLKFGIESIDYELVLVKVCNDSGDDNNVTEARNTILGGGWNVTSYTKNGMDMTDNYNDMDFNFSMMHQAEVSINDEPIAAGLWRILKEDDDDTLKFYLNLEENATLSELTEDWYVVSVGASKIELVHEDEDATETLVFEKP
ncbi:MAG: hypothetical protein AAF575_03670, partial [Bacteroidota bacterium]